jgi:predicted metal-binding membrane protein
MPGGWTMSMAWMQMPGQTWPGAAAAFVLMWDVMMAAMMLPSLVPALRRCVRALDGLGAAPCASLVLLIVTGYFFVWTAAGVVFVTGAAAANLAMRDAAAARAVPLASAVVVVLAGVVQCTQWKLRRLACCRDLDTEALRTHRGSAGFRHGIRLGLQCASCCGNLMAVLLALGVMDLRAMMFVTAAITLERVGPAQFVVPRAIGIAVFGVALLAVARATGLA